MNMDRRFRATADMWIARAGTAFGWFWFVLYALVAVVGLCDLPSAKDNMDRVMPFVCIGLAAVHFLMIRVSKRTRALVGDFRRYAPLLAENKSVSALCARVNEPREDVEKKLAVMCRRGYFRQADLQNDRMVFTPVQAAYAARCPGCGATTKIYRDGDVCRYCGNPLAVRNESAADET